MLKKACPETSQISNAILRLTILTYCISKFLYGELPHQESIKDNTMTPDKNVYRRQKYGRKVRVNFNTVMVADVSRRILILFRTE